MDNLFAYIVNRITKTHLLNWMPDSLYLKMMFKARVGKKLDLKNPKTFNEKIQWLKIHDHNPVYTDLVDKYKVRAYVAEKIGESYLIPLLGVWDHAEDIDFNNLPNQFVLKCNHDSGSVIVCKDKSKFDREAAVKSLSWHLKQNLYWWGREWPYKNIQPKVIAEQYLEDSSTKELRDYKFFVIGGEVKALFVATDRQADSPTTFDFFDPNYNHLDFRQGHPNAKKIPQKPQCFEEMKRLALALAEGIDQVRVDFYEVNGKVYFGELTFSHYSGFTPFVPEEWDYKFGEWIHIH